MDLIDEITTFIHDHVSKPYCNMEHVNERMFFKAFALVSESVEQIDTVMLPGLYFKLSGMPMGQPDLKQTILEIVTSTAIQRWMEECQPAPALDAPPGVCSTLETLSMEGFYWLATLLESLKPHDFWHNREIIVGAARAGHMRVYIQGPVLAGFYTAHEEVVGSVRQRRIEIMQSFTGRGAGTGTAMVEDAKRGGFSVVADRPLPLSLGFWTKMQVPMETP